MEKDLEFRKELGKIIARERIKKGWTQDDLAIKMDKSKSYISQIENGRVNITSDYIELIVKHLECAVNDVLNTSIHHPVVNNKSEFMETFNG